MGKRKKNKRTRSHSSNDVTQGNKRAIIVKNGKSCYGQNTNHSKKLSEEDKKKMVSLQKMMVGHYVENIPEDAPKKINYVLQGNGVYEKRENDIGVFIRKVSATQVPGLYSPITEGWSLKVPLIPAELLCKAISFFRKICKTMNESEVFLQFFFDKTKEEYFIHCPKQKVGKGSVEYENDDVYRDSNNILVFEIHSHNTMDAFFSTTDDGDEKEDRFYGVVGKLNEHMPTIKLRGVFAGKETEIKVEDIFDLSGDQYHSLEFPKEWENNVTVANYSESYRGFFSSESRNRWFDKDDDETKKESKESNFDLVVYNGGQGSVPGNTDKPKPKSKLDEEIQAIMSKYYREPSQDNDDDNDVNELYRRGYFWE